jgi:hypothetical protein
MPDVEVEITDAFGDVTVIETNANGDWSIEVPAGNTISNVNQDDPDFPVGAVQTEGTDPTTTFVLANDTVLSDNDGFFNNDPDLLGTLSGHLYIDTNGNGNQESGEPDLENIEIVITDSFGDNGSVITDANGNWSIQVPAGNTISDINQQDSDFPQGATQTQGTDPTTTFVTVGNTTFSEDDGFFVQDPNLNGILTGHLYFDDNGNGVQDVGEPDMPDVDLEIIDVFGVVTLISTDVNGDWSIEVPAGNTFSNIDQQDPDFPSGAVQTEGTDPSLTFVIADAVTLSDNDGYFVQNPDVTGTLSGHLYFDNNNDSIQNNDEPNMPNVSIQIVDGDGVSQSIVTDDNGDWTTTVAEGDVTSTIDKNDPDFPAGATQTEGSDPTITTINAGDNFSEEPDGFFTPNQTGILSGIVYEDLNGNGAQDGNEIGIEGVEVEILESDGEITSVTTNINGQWSTLVKIGQTTSSIDESSSNFPIDAIQTQGTNPTTTFVASDSTINEVPDGFFVEETTGTLTGRLYYDDNANEAQDANEDGISNISISITDINGNVFETETDANGDWSIEVLAGETISKIDTEDIDFPTNVSQTEGTDPTTALVISGQVINSDNDGFFIDDIEIFNAVGSEGNQLNEFFRIKGIENYPENSVQIFNRQGMKVYDAEGYDNGEVKFNGFSDGDVTIQRDKRLPTGTYFYILNYVNRLGEPLRRNGYLHLN